MRTERKKYHRLHQAFTLIEMLIIVAILGILAAVVMPEYQNHTQQAKEAAAKDNLRILRNAINLYAAEHGDIPPGYANNDTSTNPNWVIMGAHLLKATDENGAIADPGTAGYKYGPYISDLPENPFNDMAITQTLANGQDFPATPDDTYGWVYKADAKEIRLSKSGTDSQGNNYYDY